MTCTHDRYRTKGYMQFKDAMKDPDICWTGIVITHCEDCGQDISQYKLVPDVIWSGDDSPQVMLILTKGE